MAGEQQLSLALIPHKIDDTLIAQRSYDGYINATAMCQAAQKKLSHYLANDTTTAFVNELSSDAGIPASELIQVLKGGRPDQQGTWVHPQVAIHLAQWLSPKFAVRVSKWVQEWMSGGRYAGGTLPYHLQRYAMNRGKVPITHFSVFNELMMSLIAPLEQLGYRLPDNMVPDISQGKMFAKWMRDEHDMDTDTLPTYEHEYVDGRVCEAKMYPLEVLLMFRRHLTEIWLPKRARDYFKERDPESVPYIDQLLALPAPEAKPKSVLDKPRMVTKFTNFARRAK